MRMDSSGTNTGGGGRNAPRVATTPTSPHHPLTTPTPHPPTTPPPTRPPPRPRHPTHPPPRPRHPRHPPPPPPLRLTLGPLAKGGSDPPPKACGQPIPSALNDLASFSTSAPGGLLPTFCGLPLNNFLIGRSRQATTCLPQTKRGGVNAEPPPRGSPSSITLPTQQMVSRALKAYTGRYTRPRQLRWGFTTCRLLSRGAMAR